MSLQWMGFVGGSNEKTKLQASGGGQGIDHNQGLV